MYCSTCSTKTRSFLFLLLISVSLLTSECRLVASNTTATAGMSEPLTLKDDAKVYALPNAYRKHRKLELLETPEDEESDGEDALIFSDATFLVTFTDTTDSEAKANTLWTRQRDGLINTLIENGERLAVDDGLRLRRRFIRHVYTDVFPGIAIRSWTASSLMVLLDDPDVVSVIEVCFFGCSYIPRLPRSSY